MYSNTFSIGLSAFMAAKEAGLHADSEIEVRAVDYHGENIVAIDGVEYTVERMQEYGDFVRLTLARRLSNA